VTARIECNGMVAGAAERFAGVLPGMPGLAATVLQ
jgi:hypothetical protein